MTEKTPRQDAGLRAAERATDLIDTAARVGSLAIADATLFGLPAAEQFARNILAAAVEKGGQALDEAAGAGRQAK